MIPKVAVDLLLIFSSLGLGHGAIYPCSAPLENIAAYEGVLNTLIYFPTSNNSVKWSISPTTDELTEVDIVNYDDTVAPGYTADYAFNSSGLIIKNATTTADYNVHQLSTAGLYTAQCGGNQISFKFLVVRRGPTCSCSLVNSSSVQLTCSATYADYSYSPIAAVLTLHVNGSCTTTSMPQRTISPSGYAWISTSTFTTTYKRSSTYQCGLTFSQPMEVQDPNIAMNAPSFNDYCSVTASEYGCAGITTISPSACPSSIMTTTTRLSTTSIASGLSDGSKIGIGVGIGVGVSLVLVGILIAVLCTRNGNTKKAKTASVVDDKNAIGLEEDSERSRTKQENANVPQYEPLNVLSVQSSDPGTTYEQLTTSTYADVIEHSFSDRSTDENLDYKLKANESH